MGIPTVRDRVVQAALRHVLEPIFEREFAAHSYGFRPGKSTKDALRRVSALLKAGYTHVVDADLRSYYDTIPHQGLLARIEALLRRSSTPSSLSKPAASSGVYQNGALRVDFRRTVVTRNNKPVSVSAREFKLLR